MAALRPAVQRFPGFDPDSHIAERREGRSGNSSVGTNESLKEFYEFHRDKRSTGIQPTFDRGRDHGGIFERAFLFLAAEVGGEFADTAGKFEGGGGREPGTADVGAVGVAEVEADDELCAVVGSSRTAA